MKFLDHFLTRLAKFPWFTFDYVRLKHELLKLCMSSQFCQTNVLELIEMMVENRLISDFKEVGYLCKSISTIPSNTAL